MFLAFKLSDIITIPFGYMLDWLYVFTHNYGAALILFAILVQVVLHPITARSKKSMMGMSRVAPKLQEIQKKYADDPQRLNQATRELESVPHAAHPPEKLAFLPGAVLFHIDSPP